MLRNGRPVAIVPVEDAQSLQDGRRDQEKRRAVTLFSNGYTYERLFSPLHTSFPAYGAGDTFAGAVGALLALSASPFSATLLATALTALAVERTTTYGGATVDPVGAFDLFKPIPYLDDELAPKYAERFGVAFSPIPTGEGEGARLKFAPPRNQITY